jgi:4a-hydroxytetrahydrobiopterin dehydratase
MVGSWKEVEYSLDGRKQNALQKDSTFRSFKDALDFVNKVGEIAEKMQHHPDITLGWGYVRIWTTSHDAKKITEKDHKLTGAIDQLQNSV